MCMPVYFQGYKHSALYNILFALVARDRSTEALFVSNRYHKDKYTGVFMVWYMRFGLVMEYILDTFLT